MSKSRTELGNYYYGKRLHPVTILAAQMAMGKKVYVYCEINMCLVNNKSFVSIREAVKYLSISPSTLVKK